MTKLTFRAELSPHIPSERRALVECTKWVKLKKESRFEELKAKQKEAFLAGLFIQIAAPELAHKLAANVDDASVDTLQQYLSRISDTPNLEQLLKDQLSSIEQKIEASVQQVQQNQTIAQQTPQKSKHMASTESELADEEAEINLDSDIPETNATTLNTVKPEPDTQQQNDKLAASSEGQIASSVSQAAIIDSASEKASIAVSNPKTPNHNHHDDSNENISAQSVQEKIASMQQLRNKNLF